MRINEKLTHGNVTSFFYFIVYLEKRQAKLHEEVKIMSKHDGHRQRLRERFMAEGLDNFTQEQVLELHWNLSDGPQLSVDALRQEDVSTPGSTRVFSVRMLF